METIRSFDFKNKRVLVRCDFNVPLDERGNILDDFKIRQTLPTIEYLIKAEASKITLISHLNHDSSLKPAAKRLSELLQREVKFAEPGDIVLLENLRLNKGEEANDDNFAKELAKSGDIFINDAFAVSHRPHASLVGVPKYLPSCAGLLLEKEINGLKKLMENPAKPLIAIIGGAKAETKTAVIDKISQNADFILVGGMIACEIKEKNINFINHQKIVFPIDDVCAFDISEQTVNFFKEKIKTAKTVLWNGPLGKVEDKEFQKGTLEVAKAVIESGAYSVAGGGETVWFLNQTGLMNKFSHVSTGGGAMMAYLAGEKMPGIEALK